MLSFDNNWLQVYIQYGCLYHINKSSSCAYSLWMSSNEIIPYVCLKSKENFFLVFFFFFVKNKMKRNKKLSFHFEYCSSLMNFFGLKMNKNWNENRKKLVTSFPFSNSLHLLRASWQWLRRFEKKMKKVQVNDETEQPQIIHFVMPSLVVAGVIFFFFCSF